MISRRNFIKLTAAGGALASVGQVSGAHNLIHPALPDTGYAWESKREIPLIADVDLVIVGGSSRAVAAAATAARTGCSVYLVASMPYPGDDICGSFLIDRKEDEKLQTSLSRRIFLEKEPPLPLHVKTMLENELIDHQVDFLYSSYVTNVLTDPSGTIGGVVIANRSGRQAIRCKAVIDATHTAVVASMAGTAFRKGNAGSQEFQFTVVGNSPKEAPAIIRQEAFAQPLTYNGKTYPVTRYTFRLPFEPGSYASLMQAEQTARTLTWDPDQVDSSDLLWYIPGESIIAEQSEQRKDLTVRDLPETIFRPKGSNNLWVLGPCADIDRTVAGRFMRPVHALFLGELLGEVIGNKIKDFRKPQALSVKTDKTNATNYGQVGEILKPLRVTRRKGMVEAAAGSLPVWGSYDVVVLGGGTAGASAGITAATQGAKTLMLEYLHGLGGLGTLGLIGRYWDGFREGYSARIDEGVRGMAPESHPRQLKNWHDESPSDWKAEWYRREYLKANGELWFGVLGCGALTENNQVNGVVITTPFGRGVILSKVLIDSTGSADIAIAAGAQFDYTGKKTLAVQGAGMGKKDPGDYYINNDWLFIDDSDILDVSRVFVQSKARYRGRYDMVKIPQTRERRRVVGEHIVSVYDVLNHRRYPDTISYHKSSFDTHGMIVDPYFILSPPMARHTVYDADVPLRSLLPKGLEGILTTGLGASAHRDAMPVIRMQPCLQNQGYAVGYLAATCAREGKSLRKADMKKIQKHLVSIGNLPARVLTDKEFTRYGNKEMQAAANSVTDNYKGLEILLTQPAECIRLVTDRMRKATTFSDKVVYAGILCILGDKTYASVLKEKIEQYPAWDDGWHYTGMDQFGMSMSPLDAYLTALGNAKAAGTLPTVLDKARLLQPEDYFSHFRAICMATEAINNPDAIPVLADMLTQPGVRSHAIRSYAEARSETVPGEKDVSVRNKALKELHLARALYLCGDYDKIGESVLLNYANSLQGHYARYAAEILNLV